jgi:hypothetical protein
VIFKFNDVKFKFYIIYKRWENLIPNLLHNKYDRKKRKKLLGRSKIKMNLLKKENKLGKKFKNARKKKILKKFNRKILSKKIKIFSQESIMTTLKIFFKKIKPEL